MLGVRQQDDLRGRWANLLDHGLGVREGVLPRLRISAVEGKVKASDSAGHGASGARAPTATLPTTSRQPALRIAKHLVRGQVRVADLALYQRRACWGSGPWMKRRCPLTRSS